MINTELVTVAFLTGLIGGVAHCGPMCGSILIAFGQVRAQMQSRDRDHGALFLFQLGRILCYAGLAALLAFVGTNRWVATLPTLRMIWRVLLGLLVMLLVIAEIRQQNQWFVRLAMPINRWFKRTWQGGAIALVASGVGWGFLPCMFSWPVIVAAAASGNIAPAIAGAFGLGTAFPLFVYAFAGKRLHLARPQFWRQATQALLLIYSLFLVTGGLRQLYRLLA